MVGVTEAASIAGVSRSRIYEAIQQGHMKPDPHSLVVALKRLDVEAFRDRQKSKGGRPKKA